MNLYGVNEKKVSDFINSELRADDSLDIIINKETIRYSYYEKFENLKCYNENCGAIFHFNVDNKILQKRDMDGLKYLFEYNYEDGKFTLAFKNIIFSEGINLYLNDMEEAMDSKHIEISFENCIFLREIYLDFINEIFTTLKFEKCALLVEEYKNRGFNEIIIKKCNICSDIHLNYSSNIFSECTLEKVVLFESRFTHMIDFTEKNLTKLEIRKFKIKGCIFTEDLNLNHIIFTEEFILEKTRFMKNLNITFCMFREELSVTQCYFIENALFNLSNCKFSATVEIKLDRPPKRLYLYDSLIAGRFVLHTEAFIPNFKTIGLVKVKENKKLNNWELSKTQENYFKLYQIFVTNGEIECAHECYFLYKYYGRVKTKKELCQFWKERRRKKISVFNYMKMLISYFIAFMLEKTTRYFTSVKNSLITMICVFSIFTITYMVFPKYIIINDVPMDMSGEGFVELLNNVISFSLITLGTTGYGNIYPLGWMAIVASLESIFGVVMFAVVVTIIARKFMG